MKFLKKNVLKIFRPNPTHENLKNLDPTQPNPTHGSTQPMNNSEPDWIILLHLAVD